MIITEFKNRFSTTGKSVELTWDDLVERLKSPVITSETLAEYKAMTNEERTAIKDIGGYVAGEFTDDKRNKNLLKSRCVLTIDADEATAEDIDNYSCLYDNAVFIHTTHTSTDEQLRLRWLFPLSRPVSAEEYKALVNIVIPWVGSNTGYKHDLDRIRDRFKDAVLLKGPNDIDRWNNGEIQMLLCHPASAGYGINLQQGSHIIVWFGLPYSLEQYQQSNARLHRQGQGKTVIVHHIICDDTLDEKVLDVLQKKDATQRSLLEALKRYFA